MKYTYKKIAVIGGGTMGTILASALIKTSSAKHIVVCERNITRHKQLKSLSSRILVTGNLSECSFADVIFLAVKPQDFGDVDIKTNKQTLICSIMAGINISHIKKQLGAKKIVRMMPNTAARVGESFTAWTATTEVSASEKKWVGNFLTKIGDQLYVKTEQQIDKVTAVSGSGPAYIFNTLSVFIEAAQKLGFNQEEAYRMVRQVLRGVNTLTDEGSDFVKLTSQITSKGGTTEAALRVFATSDIKKTWTKALSAAYKRAQKLSREK